MASVALQSLTVLKLFTPLPNASNQKRSRNVVLRPSQVCGQRLASGNFFIDPLKTRRTVRLLARAEVKDEKKDSQSSVEDRPAEEKDQPVEESKKEEAVEKKQERDWRLDEDFKKFMSNPSIESALKLERKRAEEKLRDLDNQDQGNFFKGIINSVVRRSLQREKERLDKAEATFIALDLSKVRSCFGLDTFYANDVRRMGDGGIVIGNLRRPLAEVKPKLEKKLAEACGREVDLWFMEETVNDETKQVCVVQPKAEIDAQFESQRLSTWTGYFSAALLGITTLGTISIMSGFFLTPGATYDDYVSRVLPLFAGYLGIFGTSELATRYVASKYGVKLSPTFMIPSNWTGCLGVVNNYESLLPSKKALFDIAATRITSSYLASLGLAISAFLLDQSWNGGENALYIRPQFFYNNPLLSFVQYVIGPYSDELGNVLPQAVPGLGVPIDPLAFAGLLGIVVTSLNMLPSGRLEGGRIAQAVLGRRLAGRLSFFTSLGLGFGGVTGSVLSLVWGFIATFFRGGEELPAQDEITPLGNERKIWAIALTVICFLTLFPNSAGTFPSAFYTPPFFRGDDF
ncbi:probable zinc metallopeptidase EGY3, chloroplastic [Physcomitrium patens]|uniref:Peptidase M50 domain-containing protein n=1 Tax=Physcomitrium patens TaxID=3218 RepID=A0A2K1IGR6_PHYPA|nr:probable zinc metallopeptidase EGY3, chloroplastic [Physcomitrium patens]XP_024364359.1 probable zinc metallopeptidase EGY3, chloroplastic [Physcomitrium patens]XP_024364360.1 probable zinc metallopeptidase EGY3, chloroplastic [Physcomitrium patens]PNR28471.1 hypothetical protein PHYPA_029063 [Physcomitrium patens]|eukprot:XP_024364357.1 probable zinc metallopeptidase EGY3, chloroplastic [Physcomitrella patens]